MTSPRSAALGCLALYLTASGVVLLAGGHPLLALAHAGGVMLAFGAIQRRGEVADAVGDFLPLAVFPVLYAEIPRLIAAVGAQYHDATVQGWETALFSGLPSAPTGSDGRPSARRSGALVRTGVFASSRLV